MFNLDQAIADWRQRMAAGGIRTLQLDELESHLRVDVEQQMRSGLNDQRAFEIAVQRIGQASALKNEFKKIGGTSTVLERLMIGICLAFVAFIALLSVLTVFLCFATWGERVMASTAMACSLLVACGWKYAVPFLPVIASRRKRWTVALACIASGFLASSFFCTFILPHFEISPDRQVPAIGFWAVFLIAIFCCLGVGLSMSEHEREIWRMNKFARGRSTAADS